MAKLVLFILFSALFFNLSVQESAISCDKLPKCNCVQKTDYYKQIPMFHVDCSRLDLKVYSGSNILPLYAGRLDLSHNRITYLNESSKIRSSSLYYLDLSYNKLQVISDNYFQDLSQLVHLNLENNKLIQMDLLTGLINLKILNLQSNKLQILPDFMSLSSLEELNLNNNNIGDYLEDKKLSNYLPDTLRSLQMDHIQLKNISRNMFEDMVHLKKLSIAYNPFSDFPYLPLNYLEYLDISGTNINNITLKSLTFSYLKILKMNRLPHIRKIYEYTFFNLHDLEELYMEHCIKLEEIDPIYSLNSQTLKKFSVAYSGLKFLPNTFQNLFKDLKEIYLRGNFWECSCKMMWLTRVKNNVKDRDDVRCYSPDDQANKSIFSMTEDEFSCFEKKNITPHYGISTQRWLFPLIGVLAIIIFILVAILIYMGPYGQKKYRMEGKMIGPESPYSPISIHPNHAEELKI